MRLYSVKAKLIAGTMSIVLGFVVFTLVVMSAILDSYSSMGASDELIQGRNAYEQFMKLRERLVMDKVRALSGVPDLGLVLTQAHEDRSQLEARLPALQGIAGKSTLVIADKEGRLLTHTKDRGPFPQYLHTLPGVELALAGNTTDGIWYGPGRLLLVGIAPVFYDSKVAGIVILGEAFDGLIADQIREFTGHSVVIFYDKEKISESWEPSSTEPITSVEFRRLATEVARNRVRKSGLSLSLRVGGEQHLGLVIPLHENGGMLLLSRNLRDVHALYYHALKWLVLAGVAIAGIGIFLSIRTGDKLSRPLQELMRASDELADGNLAATVEVRSTDEIGAVARSFNVMAGRIAKLVVDVHESAMKVEQMSRAKDKFLASVSHELRTPLTNIRSFSEILLTYGDSQGDEHDEFLTIIKTESERLTRLINDVLDIAKIEAGKMQWHLVEFDFVELADETTKSLAGLEHQKNVRFEVTNTEPVLYHGDRDRMHQVLTNLMSNAWKFSPEGEAVTVTIVSAAECLEVRVADCGPGLPTDAAKRAVFEKFHQEGDSLTDKPSGTGLGLAITREIVHFHGGTIHCEDNAPEGAVFVVRLPHAGGASRRPVDRVVELGV